MAFGPLCKCHVTAVHHRASGLWLCARNRCGFARAAHRPKEQDAAGVEAKTVKKEGEEEVKDAPLSAMRLHMRARSGSSSTAVFSRGIAGWLLLRFFPPRRDASALLGRLSGGSPHFVRHASAWAVPTRAVLELIEMLRVEADAEPDDDWLRMAPLERWATFFETNEMETSRRVARLMARQTMLLHHPRRQPPTIISKRRRAARDDGVVQEPSAKKAAVVVDLAESDDDPVEAEALTLSQAYAREIETAARRGSIVDMTSPG